MKIEGVSRVIEALEARIAQAIKSSKASVTVGYTQNYAIFVHEDLVAHHTVGQAKFLEQPARMHQDKFRKIVEDSLRRKLTMSQALLLAGLALQRESQLLVPIDTGALKASAFTRVDII
jgi:CRISPR/Cas system-associated exonuclease Cas4 (RecB family)